MSTERKFEYNPGIRKNSTLVLGIMGPSGGGKTYSAMRLATGIQRVFPGDIAVIDTETGRALKYADDFKFQHVPFSAPFASLDCLAVAEHCVKQGAKTIVFDSMTHEHAGIGGYLEYAESELDRMAGQDWGKRNAMKLASYAKPSTARRKMIDGFLALGVNLIFCFRAKEKVKPMKNDQNKTEIVNIGFMPIGSSELVYEMDACCLLMPGAGGVPTWLSDEIGEKMMIKQAKQFESIFKERVPLSEAIGEAMANWAIAKKPLTAQQIQELEATGEAKAGLGVDKFKEWWESLTKEGRVALKAKLEAWKSTAAAVKSSA